MCVVIAFPSGFPSWFFGGPGCCISTSGECRITLTSRGRPFTSVANMQTHSEASHRHRRVFDLRKLRFYGKILEWETWIFCCLKVNRTRYSAVGGSDMMPAQDLPRSQTPNQVSSPWTSSNYNAFTHPSKILVYLLEHTFLSIPTGWNCKEVMS